RPMRAEPARGELAMSAASWRRGALACAIAAAGAAGCTQDATAELPPAPDAAVGFGPRDVRLRFVNLCSSSADLYLGDGDSPVLAGLAPGTVSDYVQTTIFPDQAALSVRKAGDPSSASPSGLELLEPVGGDRATVALRGTPCSSKTLWDASGDAA